MENFNMCEICKEYVWLDEHKCKPIYFFKHPDWGDEFQEIRGCSFRECAERFAEKYNENGDYSLMNSSEEVIISDGKTEKRFSVTAEPDIRYSAEELK